MGRRLIARRLPEAQQEITIVEPRSPSTRQPAQLAYDGPLRSRLDALRELVGLSRTRLDSNTLAEAGRVLDEAAARRRLSGEHTVVAIAGATGSGKSTLFNALAGVALSETGVRRPTTAAPMVCSWSDGAAPLIDRLGVPGRLRRRPSQTPDGKTQLQGLVLVDLPDHDSAVVQHREQVDRILALVDAVIWVVDPEKYADAVLHERYLRPLAGHAEVMFVVLNQVDRLPGRPPSRCSTICGGCSTGTGSPSVSTASRVRPCSRCPPSPERGWTNSKRCWASSWASAARRRAAHLSRHRRRRRPAEVGLRDRWARRAQRGGA